MKQQSVIVFCYALLVLIGGIIGHAVAGSQASLIASSVSAALLSIGAIRIWQGCSYAYYITTLLVFALTLFFGYRFFLSYKIAPGGIMMVMSACLTAYLLFKPKLFSKS